ncbi:1995_t:CDS:2, partial [Entrophospora sp. SA101]
ELAHLEKSYEPNDFRPTLEEFRLSTKGSYQPIKPEKRPPRLKKPKHPKYERDAPKRYRFGEDFLGKI